MKKTLILFLLALGCFSTTLVAQTDVPTKTHQGDLVNEFYGGYGAGSVFYFTGKLNHSSDYPTEMYSYNNGYLTDMDLTQPTSAGTLFLGYGRSLNKVISMGFMFGYQGFSYSGEARQSSYDQWGNYLYDTIYSVTSHDNLLSGVARVQFAYVNKPFIRMYSGVAIGVTVDFAKGTIGNDEYTERKLMPAGQLTLMGLRFGRSFGGFFEFGFGSYGIINAGVSYKIKD